MIKSGNVISYWEMCNTEGASSIWMPHQFARALVMVPCDKLALLDDMSIKIQSGKLEIKVK